MPYLNYYLVHNENLVRGSFSLLRIWLVMAYSSEQAVCVTEIIDPTSVGAKGSVSEDNVSDLKLTAIWIGQVPGRKIPNKRNKNRVAELDFKIEQPDDEQCTYIAFPIGQRNGLAWKGQRKVKGRTVRVHYPFHPNEVFAPEFHTEAINFDWSYGKVRIRRGQKHWNKVKRSDLFLEAVNAPASQTASAIKAKVERRIVGGKKLIVSPGQTTLLGVNFGLKK